METLYFFDNNYNYTETKEVDNVDIIPRNATLKAPTFKKGSIPQFVNGTWRLYTPYVYTAEELAEIAERTFSNNKALKLTELNDKVNGIFQAYLAKYPEVEVQSFTKKAQESASVLADNTTPMSLTPYLAALTNNDSVARNLLAEAVNAKVLENAQLEAWAVVTRDAIKACTTQGELDAISI